MKKTFALAAVICTLVFAGSITNAAGWNPGSDVTPDGRDQLWGQRLSPQQRQQAEKIFNDNFASMEATRQALAEKRAELDDELQSDNPDTDKIEAISRQIGELRGKMLSARVKTRSQLAEQGLPDDFYGPGGPRVKGKKRPRGPEVWHGGPHHGRGHHYGYGDRPYGYWGCPGMRGCW